jgi:hypothetical protein
MVDEERCRRGGSRRWWRRAKGVEVVDKKEGREALSPLSFSTLTSILKLLVEIATQTCLI